MSFRPDPETSTALGRFKEALLRRFGARLRSIRLFGSRASGGDHPESDIDVLVLIDGLSRREKAEVLDMAADISLDLGVDLSPLVMSPEAFAFLRSRETRLALDIEREGIPI